MGRSGKVYFICSSGDTVSNPLSLFGARKGGNCAMPILHPGALPARLNSRRSMHALSHHSGIMQRPELACMHVIPHPLCYQLLHSPTPQPAQAMPRAPPTCAYHNALLCLRLNAFLYPLHAGLCCAALLAKYGYAVTVLESHYLAGGCAHGFDVGGYSFDAGPSFFV